ncbi:hypothetical protein [Caballeronia sp.]|jgi:hypothetical protein|uniref:hypothetical protein n=1 Tax=Caballeronia sp. TaxID=1931223 RepID=UPI003C57E0C6
MVTVAYEALSEAFDYVSSTAPMDHEAYISLDTGEVYCWSEYVGAGDEEVPDDLGSPDRYLAIPHKNELGLGRSLALRFVEENLPSCCQQVEGYFSRQGAYSRFNELLARQGALEAWRAFEADHVPAALRRWCSENGVQIIES